MKMSKKNLLERLNEGIVVGDGGFLFSLEKRGYVQAGPWTPEAAVEHPEAVKQLHKEFLRAGADVVQAFTFFANEGKISAGEIEHSSASINSSACKIAREVADESGALVSGSISQTTGYQNGKEKEEVQEEFRKQLQIFKNNDIDFIICEYFENIEEMEWAIECCKKLSDKPVASTMCIGPKGDQRGILPGECAVRMSKAGADVVGINCKFDPFLLLEAMEEMKKALDEAGQKPYLMAQPLGFMTPDCTANGYIDLPEFPFAMEPRICTRWEIQKYARRAYELGVRYIGGCCGFEPYHTRAISEELEKERGKACDASKKHGSWGEALRGSTLSCVRKRAGREYWENLIPATGRPYSPALFTNNKPNY